MEALAGMVVKWIEEKQFGFIRPRDPLPDPFKRKDIHFTLRCVRGALPNVGERVEFVLNKNSADRPSAVTVNKPGSRSNGSVSSTHHSSNDGAKPKGAQGTSHSRESGQPSTHYGQITRLPSDGDFGYLKPLVALPCDYDQQSDVSFRLKEVESLLLNLMEGDVLEFTLGTKDKKRPRGFRLKLVKCRPRHAHVLRKYLDKLCRSIVVQNEEEEQEDAPSLVKLLSCKAIWRCIGDCEELDDESMVKLMEFFHTVTANGGALRGHLQTTMKELTTTKMFASSSSRFARFVQNHATSENTPSTALMKRFLIMVVRFVPEKTKAICRMIKPLLSKDSLSLEYFLFELLNEVAPTGKEEESDLEWNELPLVPSKNTLHGQALENSDVLRPVKASGPYSSHEDYLDTYVRLLWTDCFSSLQSGINDYLAGKLDLRDMNLYYDIKLAGIHSGRGNSGLYLTIQFKSCKPVANWAASPSLMFGNLLCITQSGTFKDPIWATVVERDVEMLENHRLVTIELVKGWAIVSEAEAIITLVNSGASTLMAESPTYYKAYQPVLAALQRHDPQHIPFSRTLIDVKPPQTPEYRHTESKDPFCIGEGEHVVIDLEYSHKDDCRYCSGLDQSQAVAVKQAMENEVAIIQGPPGTGKTFVGVNILKHVVKETLADGPVLVLTYKNHALDEFLKQALGLFPSSVARIGGRSSDPAIEACNITELRKNASKSVTIREQLHDVLDQCSRLQSEIMILAKRLDENFEFRPSMLLKQLTGIQLFQLLLNSNFAKIPNDLKLETIALPKSKNGRKAVLQDFLDTNKEWIESLTSIEWKTDDPLEKDLLKLLFAVIWQWMPPENHFIEIADRFKPCTPKLDNLIAVQSKKTGQADDTELDTDESQMERMAAIDNMRSNYQSKHSVNFLKEPGSRQSQRRLIPDFTDLLERLSASTLAQRENIWTLSQEERVYLIQYLLHKRMQELRLEMDAVLQLYSDQCLLKEELENQHKASILQDKRVIGMTVTGASIHISLLELIKPQVVIVEEAAEVLEPHLLALLGNWVRHLILIGDHKQLKPPVENFTLCKKYHFDISMMERLINNRVPYATLQMQNRMRPEFAELLFDIYPDLESNIERVGRNLAPKCIKQSMFFWSHQSPETPGRSYSNEEESERAVKLAQFFIHHGYKPEQITILGAYLGQVKLIRRKMRMVADSGFFDRFSHSSKRSKRAGEENENIQHSRVRVQTIDNYQGDENDIVIVSLVRSNSQNKVGFLHLRNRRCVAQSRAKCGMYFIGNKETIETSSHWLQMLNTMAQGDCVGETLALQCPTHQGRSTVLAQNANQIPMGSFCRGTCTQSMPCNTHPCPESCHPYHQHNVCRQIVEFTYTRCGHMGKRRCSQTESEVRCRSPCSNLMNCQTHPCPRLCSDVHDHRNCQVEVDFIYQKCAHPGRRECSQSESNVPCKSPCKELMECKIHACPELCSAVHLHITCKAEVDFHYKRCGHPGRRKCHQDETEVPCKSKCKEIMFCKQHPCKQKCMPVHHHLICEEKVEFHFPECNHIGTKKCYQKTTDIRCKAPCKKTMNCGIHPCPEICQPVHNHLRCEQIVNCKLSCGHQTKKMCFQSLEELRCTESCKEFMSCGIHKCTKPCYPPHKHTVCNEDVQFKFPDCGHPSTRKCYQAPSDLECKANCANLMDCKKHVCVQACRPIHSHALCRVIVDDVFPECGHAMQRYCHKDPKNVRCDAPCDKKMSCGIHTCKETCQPGHSHELCTQEIIFNREICKHTITRLCHQNPSDVKCKSPCQKKMACGIHKCNKTCQPDHDHGICDERIFYTCSSCAKPKVRNCYDPEEKCTILHTFAACGHQIKILCTEVHQGPKCQAPCPRKLGCQHPCDGLCGDPCDHAKCKICEKKKLEENKRRMAIERNDREAAIRDAEMEIKKTRDAEYFIAKKKPLSSTGETASEYYDVVDRVRKYIQKDHRWFPNVTNVEKVVNPGLRTRWFKTKLNMFDPDRHELKFHGTSSDAVEAIIKEGFRMPTTSGMFGKGIYFATDASKSAQDMYTKGSHRLLLCDVLLGRSKTVDRAVSDMDQGRLRREGFDSLYAKRDTRGTGGVRFDEFVVYDPYQALPKYIVHYQLTGMENVCDDALTMGAMANNTKCTKHTLYPSRHVDLKDPKDIHFRVAESQFMRLMANRRNQGIGSANSQVTSVDYYVNPRLVQKFERKAAEMKSKYGNQKEASYVLAFHGTSSQNIPLIVEENFRMDKIQRGAYGWGIYFSEFPDVSVGYASGSKQLLLCKVLPGKSGPPGNSSATRAAPYGYDSAIVRPDSEGKGEMIVIFDPDQVLPCYVINHT